MNDRPAESEASPPEWSARLFWPLFALQTATICALLYLAVPAFVAIADSLGRAVELSSLRIVALVTAVSVFHAAYWTRLRWASLPVMPKNSLLTHTFLFLSRLSFVFGAAFFSLVAFRHLPALAVSPELFAVATRGALLLAVLFSLFCYSLEFERIGRETDRQQFPSANSIDNER